MVQVSRRGSIYVYIYHLTNQFENLFRMKDFVYFHFSKMFNSTKYAPVAIIPRMTIKNKYFPSSNELQLPSEIDIETVKRMKFFCPHVHTTYSWFLNIVNRSAPHRQRHDKSNTIQFFIPRMEWTEIFWASEKKKQIELKKKKKGSHHDRVDCELEILWNILFGYWHVHDMMIRG